MTRFDFQIALCKRAPRSMKSVSVNGPKCWLEVGHDSGPLSIKQTGQQTLRMESELSWIIRITSIVLALLFHMLNSNKLVSRLVTDTWKAS